MTKMDTLPKDRTIYKMFQETVQKYPTRPALRWKPTKNDDYKTLTYSELDVQVKAARRAFHALGLRRGDSVAVLSEGRPEWVITDLAAHSLGLRLVAPYTVLPAQQTAHVIRDSRAKAVIVSDLKLLKKVGEIRESCPSLHSVIVLTALPEEVKLENATLWTDFLRVGKDNATPENELDAISASISADETATLIYTSGTTGDPKGAMLSHRNVLHTIDRVYDDKVADLNEQDVFLSFLPLSHITERDGYYLAVRGGACTVYSQGLSSLGEELTTTVRPSAILCVPRLWENIYEKALDGLEKRDEKTKKKIFWAIEVGHKVIKANSEGKSPGLLTSLQYKIADKLILSKIREKVTGGNLRHCVSGGAPLSGDAAKFFLALGVNIMEGYGLSECNIISINRLNRQRIGTVGEIMPYTETKLAPDGELLVRGEGVMSGYFNQPETTAEAIDSEGWFHTGDIVELSSDGYIKITDRKKDILILTNGKKVAPQPIETLLKQSPYIGEAVLFGDRQATISALIVPAFDKLVAWAKTETIEFKKAEELLDLPAVQKLIKSEIDLKNATLADYEKIKRFKLIHTPFSIEAGELTPSLKVKRKVVAQKYAELITEMAR